MRLHPTFAAYISRQFLTWWFGILLVLLALIALFDTIEIMRRTASLKNVTITDILAMVLFKLPHLAQKAIPFTVLFGGMMAFWRLNRHHELVVARASQMEARYFKSDHSLAAISGKGLWLRQTIPGGNYILHASKITPATMSLRNVIVFKFRGKENFASRIDAELANLGIKQWHLENVKITAPEKPLEILPKLSLPTNLTQENIQDSFAKPETMSFWALPGFIDVLEKAGFSGLRHRLYWHSQLADPILLCAMILFAAGFTMRPTRRGGATGIVILGVATGVLIYFTTDVAYALGLSSRLPVFLAAWSPATVGCLLGAGLLFHLEDG
jgi:lipopolysaccharide export system permease protein